MQADDRKHYRTIPDEEASVKVHVLHEGQWASARVSNVSIGGIGLVITGVPLFEAGKTCFVRIATPELPAPVIEAGKIEHIDRIEKGTHYGIEFLDWLGLIERIPIGLNLLFNRRGSARIPVEDDQAVHLYFEAEDIAQVVDGTLCNLSRDGLSFCVEPVAGSLLLRARLVLASFHIPGTDVYLSFRTQLRHIRKGINQWQIGAYFNDDGIEFDQRRAQLSAFLGKEESVEFSSDTSDDKTKVLRDLS